MTCLTNPDTPLCVHHLSGAESRWWPAPRETWETPGASAEGVEGAYPTVHFEAVAGPRPPQPPSPGGCGPPRGPDMCQSRPRTHPGPPWPARSELAETAWSRRAPRASHVTAGDSRERGRKKPVARQRGQTAPCPPWWRREEPAAGLSASVITSKTRGIQFNDSFLQEGASTQSQ